MFTLLHHCLLCTSEEIMIIKLEWTIFLQFGFTAADKATRANCHLELLHTSDHVKMVISVPQRYCEMTESASLSRPGRWKVPSALWICPTYPSGKRAWRQRANKADAYPPLRKVILCSIFNVEDPPTSVKTATANWKRSLAGPMREDFSLWNLTDRVARKGRLRHLSCG